MQNDCQIYVDPEEDEVFFGRMSEREKSICTKLVKHAVPSSKDICKLNKVLDGCVVNVDENFEERLGNKQLTNKTNKEVVVAEEPTESNELTSEKKTDSSKISNTSVELEHNYSTPMKHQIDKSILATPKSVVKADKDGGFLKILSEIALVKAEAEGDSNSESKKEDEDKENKIAAAIPEIKITEATPEKGVVASPPNAISTNLRRFRIIYNSPRNEDNLSHRPKSNVESLENERNFKNKRLDQEAELLGSHRRKKSVDLIDFTDSGALPEKGEKKDSDDESGAAAGEGKPDCDVITLMNSPDQKEDAREEIDPRPPVRFSKEARKVVEVLKKSAVEDTLNFTIPEINVEEEENSFLSPEPTSAFDETVVANHIPVPVQSKEASSRIRDEEPAFKSETKEKRTPFACQTKVQPIKCFTERRVCNEIGCEARKCVKRVPLEDKRPATVEKANGIAVKGMSHQMPSSRIPVIGTKNSKIPVFERVARPAGVKTTPSKTPSAKSFKNPKFNHIESPINAYIHNKPTALVLNVKPEVKKENVIKMWKTQTGGSGKKVPEKSSKEQNASSAIKLPFVEYKSASSYKIEKRPESRLPRLAPTVYKLIGSNLPKVLRHEGRFYMNSPRKENSTENTIVADPNEVSVVVSQPAQKSHTIK